MGSSESINSETIEMKSNNFQNLIKGAKSAQVASYLMIVFSIGQQSLKIQNIH